MGKGARALRKLRLRELQAHTLRFDTPCDFLAELRWRCERKIQRYEVISTF
jgi:hypothetical protein